MKTIHLQISGRVQGVYFRESMCIKAHEFGITGWVRNRADGTVEAVIQGIPENIEAMIEWSRHGPPAAKVEGISIQDATGDFEGFERRPSV